MSDHWLRWILLAVAVFVALWIIMKMAAWASRHVCLACGRRSVEIGNLSGQWKCTKCGAYADSYRDL